MIRKPTESHRVCPCYVRQVQSKYFHGIKCTQFYTADSIGRRERWTEADRDQKLRQHCFDHYLSCPLYRSTIEQVKRK